jgi:hypothetical protein
LLTHGISNPLVRAASVLPAIWPWRHQVHLGFATFNNLRRLQLGQVLKPEACGLDFTVAELPRLDDLRRGAMAELMTLTGFSMHQRSIGASISKRTKFKASACSRCLRQKCRLPLTAKWVQGG